MIQQVTIVSVKGSPWALQALWAAFFCGIHNYVRRKHQLALDRINANPPRWYTCKEFYRKCGEVRALLRRRYSYRLLNPDLL